MVNLCEGLGDGSAVKFESKDLSRKLVIVSTTPKENIKELLETDTLHGKRQGFKIYTEQAKLDALELRLKCDVNADKPDFRVSMVGVEITTKDACGQVNEAARLLASYKYLAPLLMIALGIVLLLWGGYKWTTLVSGVGFICGAGCIFFMFYAFVNYKSQLTSYIIIGVVMVIVGILVAMICKAFIVISYVLVGFVGGLFLSRFMIVTFRLHLIDWQIFLVVYAVAIIMGAACAFFGKKMMIVLTSIVGGLMISYNFGFLINKLGNFMDLLDKLRSGQKMVL